MQIQTIRRYPFMLWLDIGREWLESRSQILLTVDKDVEKLETHVLLVEIMQLCWKTVWHFLQRLSMELSYDPAISLLVMYPEELEIYAHTKTGKWMVIGKWKSLSCAWLFATPWTVVHGILQARILEWVAFPFSSGSSQSRNRTWVSCIAGGFFTNWVTRDAHDRRSIIQNSRKVWTTQMSIKEAKYRTSYVVLFDFLFLNVQTRHVHRGKKID